MIPNADFKLFGSLSKAEEQEDGTIKVWGICSSESKDSQGDIILADAMEKAIPEYLRFPAVREMHQPTTAAGRALEIDVDPESKVTNFCAHVTDPVAVLKVKTKTYNGFSVGGRVLKRDPRNKNVITDIELAEVSLVDRPANPDSVFELVKFDTGGAVNKSGEAKDLKKGLGEVQWATNILQSLDYLRQAVEAEAAQEGDNSPIPEKIKTQVREFGETLKSMLAEEVAELTGEEAPASEEVTENLAHADNPGEIKENAAMAEPLAKQAVRLSKASKEALMDIHKSYADAHENVMKAFKDFSKCYKEACDKLADFWEDPEEDEEDDDLVEDAQKEDKPSDKPEDKKEDPKEDKPEDKKEDTKKEDAAKAAQTEDLKKVMGELDLLKAELAALKAQPATPKGLAKSVAVDKSADVLGKSSPSSTPLTGQAAELDLMKAALSRPLNR